LIATPLTAEIHPNGAMPLVLLALLLLALPSLLTLQKLLLLPEYGELSHQLLADPQIEYVHISS
jgi:hypothetical protein